MDLHVVGDVGDGQLVEIFQVDGLIQAVRIIEINDGYFARKVGTRR
jgi:hypothetical protein